MKTFLQALQYFPSVLSSVAAVEQVVGTAASGASKKQLIMDSVAVAAKIGEAVPQVALISGLIDQVVTSLNTIGVFKHAAPK
jgi:hypothetical protein